MKTIGIKVRHPTQGYSFANCVTSITTLTNYLQVSFKFKDVEGVQQFPENPKSLGMRVPAQSLGGYIGQILLIGCILALPSSSALIRLVAIK